MPAMKPLSAAVLATCAVLASAPARASDLRWSVHIGLPLPAIVVPAPVVVAPVYPAPRAQPWSPAWRDRDRDGIPDWRDPYDNRRAYGPPAWRDPYDNRRGHAGPAWRDRDRDGVPDRYDPRDNRWDGRHRH